MTSDRITEVRIEGLRALKNVRLDPRGLTILIGDNGAGKSTLLEAFELLRKAGTEAHYINSVLEGSHGPFRELMRRGGDRLMLGVTVQGTGPRLDYEFSVRLSGTSASLVHERLDVHAKQGAPEPLHALLRTVDATEMFDQQRKSLVKVSHDAQALSAFRAAQGLVTQEAFTRLQNALAQIECHPPFDVRPLWQQRELQTQLGPRWPSPVEPAEQLKRYAFSLPAALIGLRNEGGDIWARYILRARSAIDADLTDIAFPPAGGSRLDAELKFRSGDRLPLRLLSEGQLSYLAMLAVIELNQRRSILVLDEPDIHYHPELSVNLVQFLEEAASLHPIIVATHSDRMLDAIQDPASSVILCERTEHGTTLRRPNTDALNRWRQEYQGRGLGTARAEGYQRTVFEGGPLAGSSKP